MTGRIGGGSGDGGQVAQTDKPEGEAKTEEPPSGAALATLTVQTTPADAKVTVGDKVAEGESPFIISGLAPGKNKLVVTREGYLPFEREVDVPASGLSFPVPPLEHKDVTLVLDSDPPGASMNLIVDGKAVAMGTAGSQHKLSREPGTTYEVEASLKGFVTAKVPLRFTGDESQSVRVTLVRDQTVADASTTERPPDSDTGTTSAKSTTKSTSSRSKSSSSSSSSSSKPKATPPPTAAKTATLKIGTTPGVPPAKVSIDGQHVGTTPIQSIKVAPGSRKVKFEWTDRAANTQTVTVGDNETKIVKGG
jgi:eukaryotic-like serine/threonine-protein kinase